MLLDLFLVLSPALAIPQAAPPTPSTPPAVSQRQLTAQDLERELRASVRWLRGAQNVLDGSYGEGHLDTAHALLALAASPDGYRAADGPFVRRAAEFLLAQQASDGSFPALEAGQQAHRESTLLAARALYAVQSEPFAAAAKRALTYLELSDAKSLEWPTSQLPLEQARSLAEGTLAARNPQAYWEGPAGRVRTSAQAMLELSRCLKSLASGPAAAPAAPALTPLEAFEPANRERAKTALEKGAHFLAQASDNQGRFGAPGKPDAGITAMCLSALLCTAQPRPAELQAKLDAGLTWLAGLQQADGSIHDGKLANYITSASIMALSRAGRAEFEPVVARARAFLGTLQADEDEGYSEGDLYYGGIGYGSTERPDLSNLQMALEALAVSGSKPADPAFAKALRYLQRCQNRSESNDIGAVLVASTSGAVASGNDGGSGYAPGDSKAGFAVLADGTKVPRSYGSMTYALLKCYVFAGLTLEDPRLKAAWDWCQANYTLDLNPGFEATADPSASYQGMFYYLSTMARALDVLGVEQVKTSDGMLHPWRAELSGRLVAMQSKLDGSWINHNSQRWNEGNPLLATAYALIALDATLQGPAR